jgi:hypothetical protein
MLYQCCFLFYLSKTTITFIEIFRKKIGGRVRGSEMTRKPARKPHGICRLVPAEVSLSLSLSVHLHVEHRYTYMV